MDILKEALNYIDVKLLTYDEWLRVGMALKEEGFSCETWDEWSRADTRYHVGECSKKWASFNGNSNPVTGGTIIELAKNQGWEPEQKSNMILEWDAVIESDDRAKSRIEYEELKPTEELLRYIEVLFDDTDIVGYVSTGIYRDKNDRWRLPRGIYSRTAQELKECLKKYPDDLAFSIGDWNPEAGAFIHINPLDGNGVKTDNVARFRYALVESDDMPLAKQNELLRKLELPIACMVYSGSKSIHAIVRIDAKDYPQYKERVSYLYEYLSLHGMTIDTQNRNPSRLSRMPGVTRNGKRQKLIAVNIGKKNWDEWIDFVEEMSDDLPKVVSLDIYKDNRPELPEELIAGILRRGHKMLVSGSSKAAKSFLLIELIIAIAEGKHGSDSNAKKVVCYM